MKSIFTQEGLFTKYNVSLQFEGRIAGSIPSSPLATWEMSQRQIMTATGQSRENIKATEVYQRAKLYLLESGRDLRDLTPEDITNIAKEDAEGNRNIFRRDQDGLYLPSHVFKAALKEAVNVLYAKERWGKTGKGPIGFVSERVFFTPDHITLCVNGELVKEAHGTALYHGSVSGPQGPRTIVTQHEYVEKASVTFQLRVLAGGGKPDEQDQQADRVMSSRWPTIFGYMESNGIGSLRKLSGYGTFVTTAFDLVTETKIRLAK